MREDAGELLIVVPPSVPRCGRHPAVAPGTGEAIIRAARLIGQSAPEFQLRAQ